MIEGDALYFAQLRAQCANPDDLAPLGFHHA